MFCRASDSDSVLSTAFASLSPSNVGLEVMTSVVSARQHKAVNRSSEHFVDRIRE